MNSSSKYSRNRALIAALAIFSTALFLQTALSYFLFKAKNRIANTVSEGLGYSLTLSDVSFDFLRGFHFKDVSLYYPGQGKAVAQFQDIFIRVKIVPLFFKRIEPGSVSFYAGTLLSRKEEEGINLQIIFSDIYKRSPPAGGLSLRASSIRLIYINEDFQPTGIEFLLKNTNLSMRASGKTRFKSEIELNYEPGKEIPLSRYFKNGRIRQSARCVMDSTMHRNDLNVDSLTLKIGSREITGTGLIKGFAGRNPRVDIGFLGAVLTLGDIEFFNDNFNAYGDISVSLRASGLLDDLKARIDANLYNCFLEYALPNQEVVNINDIGGQIEFENMRFSLKRARFKLNNLPLFAELKLQASREPDITLRLSLAKDFLASQNLPLKDAEASFKGKIKEALTGDLAIKAVYIRKDSDFDMQANCAGLKLDYGASDDTPLKIKSIELIKNDLGKLQKLKFTDFSSMLELSRGNLYIKEINFAGYNGTVSGALSAELRTKPNLNLFLYGHNLDISMLTQDMLLTNKFLSGSLDSKIEFNNYSKEFLRGDCYVRQGAVDLTALAESLNLPALKNIDFSVIHVNFAVYKDLVKLRGVKLLSRDIRINAFWNIDKNIDGIVNAKISVKLLNDSPQFKRLLSISGTNRPFIDFKFLLGGTPSNMRTMWMKGDFKEKLEEASPGWIKRRIESGLDSMIDGL